MARLKFTSIVITTLIGLTGFAAAPANADKVYWTVFDGPRIQRANLDGSEVELLLDDTDGVSQPISIDLHLGGGKMYFTDPGVARVRRADLDGENLEDLVTGLGLLSGIAVDPANRKIYWCDFGTDKIQRANLDGTGVTDVVTTGLVKPQGIALDVVGERMYWTDTDAHKIARASLEGEEIEDLVTGLGSLAGIALDVSNGKMYWCNWTDGIVHRANLEIPQGETPGSRSDIENVVAGLMYPNGLALDLTHGLMFWTDTDTMSIHRATLDGQGVQTIVTIDEGLISGITLDVSPDPVPAVSTWGLAVMILLMLSAGTVVFVRRGRGRAV
jgi:sugar lactone lactonase YvrE